MNSQNTGAEERDQWRERIMSALKDLRGDESSTVGRMRSETRNEAPPRPRASDPPSDPASDPFAGEKSIFWSEPIPPSTRFFLFVRRRSPSGVDARDLDRGTGLAVPVAIELPIERAAIEAEHLRGA